MEAISVSTLDELKAQLGRYGDNFLFRGQTAEYLVDGAPNLNSSFARSGCVPPLMLKWVFYATELLRRGGFDTTCPSTMHFVEGLLQHYGWRSFFVDLTSDPAVAAWFASHGFHSKRQFAIAENASEEPVMLMSLNASYLHHEGPGHLYILDKTALAAAGHELISLEEELTTDCPSRFQRQKAWLAGIFREQRRLSVDAIAAKIGAPAAVFAALSNSAGYQETDDLFPSPRDDALLANLLDLPWLKMPSPPGAPFPFYQRSLEIPEYHDSYKKHLPPTATLYTPIWLSDMRSPEAGELNIRVPETAFYAHPDGGGGMPQLAKLLEENHLLQIESEGLICYPALPNSLRREKGIWVQRKGASLVEVSGVSIDYDSDQPTGFGVDKGYTYELTGKGVVRREAETDCPCGDPARHEHHLRALKAVEQMLGEGKVVRQGPILTISLGRSDPVFPLATT